MQPWERLVKRTMDITLSFSPLPSVPVWLMVVLRSNSIRRPRFLYAGEVGRDETFKVIKFRSMYQEAEKSSGPVWANKEDPHHPVGRILRRLRIDEVPQFINVLDGDMSLIGPRPERPFFVNSSRKKFRYKRRLKVPPSPVGPRSSINMTRTSKMCGKKSNTISIILKTCRSGWTSRFS